VLQPLGSQTIETRRGADDVVGRPAEVQALTREIARAHDGLACVTLEGEPGIGKTRLMAAAADLAQSAGFVVIGVAADEELHGPFLLARGLMTCAALRELTEGTPASEAVARAIGAVEGRDDPGLGTLPPEQKVLRTYDLAAVAIREAASLKPLAILIDDLQWADDDSTRLLRYVLRTTPQSPLFVSLAIRAEATAGVTEATTLLADLDRMGLLRRVRLARFPQAATGELLRRLLGGPVAPSTVATIHGQSEGVPFVAEELARAYRSGAALQNVDGTWTLGSRAERLLPSSVRTLVERRALRVPAPTRALLGEAAVLGRSFRIGDLEALRRAVPSQDASASLADDLAPAIAAGLLTERTGGSADYVFTHEQVRQVSLTALPAARRRALDAAMVELLGGDAAPDVSLAAVAQHAIAAGDLERAAALSVRAADVALRSRAPEEVLRIVESALLVATAAHDRVRLLRARDDALAMMRRSSERLETLAELGALVDALGEQDAQLDVLLRRAATFRADGDHAEAAVIARDARARAKERGAQRLELLAALELGQDLLRSDLGEGTMGIPAEADLDGAREAYSSAVQLAQATGDVSAEASATRELGVVALGRLLAAYQGLVEAGGLDRVRAELAAGATLEQIVQGGALQPDHDEAERHFQRALELFERLGDRRGVMSSVIGLAQAAWGTEIRFGFAQRIEDIRRLWTRMRSFTTETERAAADAQMLFGTAVFSLAKGAYDLALRRGEQAHRAARVLGDRTIEFAAAGIVARTHFALGEVAEAQPWIERAAAAAAAAPTVTRTGLLEVWRTECAAASGDAAATRDHLQRLLAPREQEKPAERCGFFADAALASMRLAVAQGDEPLIELSRSAADEVVTVAGSLPGHPPYGSQARAALAAAGSRGDKAAASELAIRALKDWDAAQIDDIPLALFLTLGQALATSGPPEEWERLRVRLGQSAALIAQRIVDDEIRARFFRGPDGKELVRLAGRPEGWAAAPRATAQPSEIDAADHDLLRLLADGRTNREIADALGLDTAVVAERFARLFARIQVGSRAEATALALREGIV
jgi:DNA-binding CsgD family transcriptional regulator